MFSIVLAVLVFAALVSAATVLNSPSVCSGEWANCSYAFADNGNVSTASVNASVNKTETWSGYNFSIPSNASINNVTVRADFSATRLTGYIDVRVSGDGGQTFGPSHVVGGNLEEQTFLIDVTNDTAWTPAKMSNENLSISVTCFKHGIGLNPTCKLDWLPVNVTYS